MSLFLKALRKFAMISATVVALLWASSVAYFAPKERAEEAAKIERFNAMPLCKGAEPSQEMLASGGACRPF